MTINSPALILENEAKGGHMEKKQKNYLKKRKKLSGLFFETALPNEYLVEIGRKNVKPILGGKRMRLFRKYLRVPAYVQTLYFSTDNANLDYQGIGIEGYASWRINPECPELAISTLDFFDDDDPMEKTNDELRTICVEAVRHVIANMNIDDALKKKAEIADKLKVQLKKIEERWGIIFDQVGIEKVRVMSAQLFEDLQSNFRNQLRLEVEKTRINTDKEVAFEENNMKEKTELHKLETDETVGTARLEKEKKIKTQELEKNRDLSRKEREITEKEYRLEMEFKQEQEQTEYNLKLLKKNLEIELQDTLIKHLKTEKTIEGLRSELEKGKLELKGLEKELDQTFTGEFLTSRFINSLPEIYKAIKIDSYSVLDSGQQGISPLGKILTELMTIVKNSDFASLVAQNVKKKATTKTNVRNRAKKDDEEQ